MTSALRTVLLIEDHEATRVTLAGVLSRENWKVSAVASAGAAYERLRGEEFDLVLTDLRLPDGDGMDVLAETKRLSPDTPVILVTGHGSEEIAVKAIQAGAFNYLTKPVDLNRLRAELEGACRWRGMRVENAELQQELLTHRRSDGELIGVSPAIRRIKDLVEQVGPAQATILITGDSGVGKEVVACALQSVSKRSHKPFVKINVAALPRELLESELFGHEKGAFTGALRTKKGRFELADGGTMFLDEIAECPPSVQVKLLRVLQEQAFERVGGTDTIRTDVRLICATNRDLKAEMAAERFRQDLYFRINVVMIHIPPLRERMEDLDALLPHFLKMFPDDNGRVRQFSKDALETMRRHSWPGNVRELRNAVEHSCLLTNSEEIPLDALPEDVRVGAGGVPFLESGSGPTQRFSLDLTMAEVEKRFILAVYDDSDRNKTVAAKRLGIGLKTLYRKLLGYGVE
jgi:two-component system response regulator HydG